MQISKPMLKIAVHMPICTHAAARVSLLSYLCAPVARSAGTTDKSNSKETRAAAHARQAKN